MYLSLNFLKTVSFVKLFFLLSCLSIFVYTILAFYTFHTAYFTSELEWYQGNTQDFPNPDVNLQDKHGNLRYILLWTRFSDSRNIIGEGQSPFYEHRCSIKNCYLTTDKDLLNEDLTQFDAVIFHVHDLQNWKKINFPQSRSYKQKYIFHSMESSDNIPICSVFADEYFNWTWSYKLDSDFVSPIIEVKDLNGHVVAPKVTVNWETNMTLPLDIDIEILKQKKKALAWIVGKCETRNNRMRYAKRLQVMFKQNSLVFDIYGCGQLECSKERCLETIKRDYYFYFASEDTNAEDYVTEEVLTAYNQYAVPIVFGAANYRKFLPEGSYLNARTKSIDKLVALVEYIIRNPKIYYSFHRWRNHYVISEAEKFKGICEVCEYLNDESKSDVVSVKKDFRKWWYSGPLFERCFPKSPENLTYLSYVNESRRHLKKVFKYSGS